MMSKPIVFTFEFESGENWGFIVSDTLGFDDGDDILQTPWFGSAFDTLENSYGVHDYSTSPNDTVIGIGYCTYEVEPELISELMEKWRQVFIEQGGEVSDSVQFVRDNSGDDATDYNDIKKLVGSSSLKPK